MKPHMHSTMNTELGDRLRRGRLNRRDFLRLSGWTALAALPTTPLLTGCAKNPVTGESELMLVNEQQEIQLDRQAAPHQFSTDYGKVQDPQLDAYIASVGRRMAALTHRPHLPYSFTPVNAAYVNAYTFPAGSVACTRGILLDLQSEAELAALLGHELGHVNMRHTAGRISQSQVLGTLVAGGTAFAGSGAGAIVSTLGSLGGQLLLASYSREDEREADALGLKYMVDAGYTPEGMVSLLDMLNKQHDRDPSALEVMFATHPMSVERLNNTRRDIEQYYTRYRDLPRRRASYMDATANLRKQAPAVRELQKGSKEYARKRLPQAEGHYKNALRAHADDYAGLCMMSACQLAQKRPIEARRYAMDARTVYPSEPRAMLILGVASIASKDFDDAYAEFSSYERRLPGNPGITFMLGLAAEGQGNVQRAATHYRTYLNKVRQGDMAQYAYTRLRQWGYAR